MTAVNIADRLDGLSKRDSAALLRELQRRVRQPRRSRRGEGTIIEVRPGLFRAQVSLGIDPQTGKRVRWSEYAATEDEARRKRATFFAQRRDTHPSLGDRDLTLRAWLEQWVEQVKDNPRTDLHRRDKLRPVMKHLGHIRLHSLRQRDVHELLNVTLTAARSPGATPGSPGAKPLSPRTRGHVRAVLRAALNDAMEDDDVRLERNVAKGVKVKGLRDDFEPRVLDEAEVTRFLIASAKVDNESLALRAKKGLASITMHALWVLALELGMREGELLGLQWRHVRFASRELDVHQQLQRIRGGGSTAGQKRRNGKNFELVPLKSRNSRRTLPLNGLCVGVLRAHRAHQDGLRRTFGAQWNALDLVFPTITGLPTQGSLLRELLFHPVCDAADIPHSTGARPDGLRIHDLRHTAATRLLRRFKNLVRTQVWLGHSTTAMTERYVHILPVEERRLVA